MQPITTIHTTRRLGNAAILAGLLTLVLAVGAVLIALWSVNQPSAPAAPTMIQAASQPHSRLFADEAASVTSMEEYAALGESYLPPATVRTNRKALPASRSFADQAADRAAVAEYAALGESYLPPATVQTSHSAPLASRSFADQAADVAAVAEYAVLGEDYLAQPAGSTHSPRRAITSRIFADEALGSATLDLATISADVRSPEVTPLVGPR